MAVSVTQFTARVPVSGDLYGDASKSVLAVAEKLAKAGYGTVGRAIETGKSKWTGGPIYEKVEFTLRRQGAPFDGEAAARDLQQAASSIGLKLSIMKDWVIQIVKFTAEAPGTTIDFAAKKKAEYDACIAAGGSALTCGPGTAGLPKWVVPVGIGLAVLFVLGQIASIKRTFLGGAPNGGY